MSRLGKVISEFERRLAKLAECHAADRAALADIIASGDGRLSPTSPKTVRANAAVEELREAELAAKQGLPAAQAAHRAAVERVRAAAAEREIALHAVAVEAAEEVAVTFTEALNRALAIEASILSLREALTARVNAGDPSAGGPAERITLALRQAKAAAGVPRVNSGQQLLDALAGDPAASL